MKIKSSNFYRLYFLKYFYFFIVLLFHGVIFAKSLDLGAGVGVEMAGGSLSSVYQRTKMRKVQLLRWTRGTLSQRYHHHHHHHRDRPFQLLLLPRYVGGATWVLWR